MFRLLLLSVVHVLLIPPLSLAAILLHLVVPRWEPIERIGRWWTGASLWACGARVCIENMEHIEQAAPCVIVCNHTSPVDIYVVCRYLPIPYRIPAKAELFRLPFFGWAIGFGGVAVPLDRNGGRRDREMVDRLGRELHRNAVLLFFAEGTRSRDGRLRPLKMGAFVTAIKEQVPVVPMVISGAHKVQAPGRYLCHAGEVRVQVLDPIDTRGMAPEHRHELAARAHAAMAAALPEDQRPT